jgi:2-polyprenyl-6-methoxyphenol hydroxylase-like FAD-dependent oxidoreductase
MADVLVVGAGPTGLTAAAQLHAHGVEVRVVERRHDRAPSRAFVVHPRTLEVLAPSGITPRLLERGDPSATVHLHAGLAEARVELGHPALDDTAYPYLLLIPQRRVEEALEEHLAQAGVRVERGVELVHAWSRADDVRFELHADDGSRETGAVPYLLGCDGADSRVRTSAGLPFPARTYRAHLQLADVVLEDAPATAGPHAFVGDAGILFLFPASNGARWRLLSVRPDPSEDEHRSDSGLQREPSAPVGTAELQRLVDRFTDGTWRLEDTTWSALLQLRRAQAGGYRAGRVLIAGDAAHRHSPAGAQGMNTGIQDACNLGWKLALVVRGAVPERLLDSYEAERWPVARRTRQLTDLAFLGEASDVLPLRWARRCLAPALLPLVGGRRLPAPAFRALGGLVIRYRHSPIVHDEGADQRTIRVGHRLRAGDRLPDGHVVAPGPVDLAEPADRSDRGLRPGWLHERLRRPAHHLLLCGPRGHFDPADLRRVLAETPFAVAAHHLTPRPDGDALSDPDGRLLRRLGVTDAAVVLVRPDGYVAYRRTGPDLTGLRGYLGALARLGTAHRDHAPTDPTWVV